MTDVFDRQKRSEIMRRIRATDTSPELAVRRDLFSRGFRYRLHVKGLPGKPDVVLPRYRTVIQVRGCFWHGHDCRVSHKPKSNKEYWGPKIARNMDRDNETDRALRELGWHVECIWECVCRNPAQLADMMSRVAKAMKLRQSPRARST